MAHNATVEEVRKRNLRLEHYLKRELDVDSFERIRAHDACLVQSEKEDKEYKFIILSDEWIYLTENPPKTLSKVIHMRDVTAIEMVKS